jgi:hypothetical protein
MDFMSARQWAIISAALRDFKSPLYSEEDVMAVKREVKVELDSVASGEVYVQWPLRPTRKLSRD